MLVGQALMVISSFYKACCLQPFSLRSKKLHVEPEESTIGTWHLIVVIFLYFTYHIYILGQTPLDSTDSFAFVLNTYGRYGFVVVALVAAVIRLFNQKKVMGVIRIVQNVDDKFFALTAREIDSGKWLLVNFFLLCLGVYAIIVIEQANCITYIRNGPILTVGNCMFLCYMPLIFIFLAEMQYLSFLMLITDRFRAIRDETLRTVKKLPTAGKAFYSREPKRFLKLIEMYHSLMSATEMTNSAFAIQNYFVTGSQFIMLVNMTYDLCYEVTKYS